MKFLFQHKAGRPLWAGVLGVAAAGALTSAAAEVDIAKLPPPASQPVDYRRDILPLFEASCFRCHGAEKPKGRFSLSGRAAALKGGEEGVDIIPGESAKSPLIHYVARLVPDMAMPPDGKGEPLTPAQIALLRAWIDQGAAMPADPNAGKPHYSISPTLRFVTVSGNERKFREHQRMREGWSGGAAEFSLRETLRPGETVKLDGHAIPDQDEYDVRLTYEKRDVGFVRGGFEKSRKYYDDTGGYYAGFATPAFALDQDLFVDRGTAWVDFGLTLPDWPRIVIGYEYRFREGAESTLNWGDSTQGGETRKIFPAFRLVDETTHILKLDLDHTIAGFHFEDNFRAEFYNLATTRTEVSSFTTVGPAPDTFAVVRDSEKHFQGVNSFMVEKTVNDWLHTSLGHLYSRTEADAAFSVNTLNAGGAPVLGDFWNSQQLLLDQETHVVNLNALLGPWEGLTFTTGLQTELTRQHGLGNVALDFGDPVNGPYFPQAAMVRSDHDKTAFQENFTLRYTQIPFTVLYAEARLEQERIGQLEQQAGTPTDFGRDFLRDTDARMNAQDYRAGFTVSPWSRVSLNGWYRHGDRDSEYNDRVDQTALPGIFNGVGYPGFIRSRQIVSDEAGAKLVLRPANWLKTTLSYKQVASDFTTTTDALLFGQSPGGAIEAGNHDAHVYSVNAVLTPWRRLYLSSTVSFSQSRTAAAQNGNVSVVPYRGDIWSVLTSGTYALNDRMDLQASYVFTRADFGQNNGAAGLPLGAEYQQHEAQAGLTRRFKNGITARLQYAFWRYDEPHTGGVYDYVAHGVFATLAIKWP